MLNVENLNVYYGQSKVLHDVSIRAEKGETVSLIGRNGAGKTTLLKSLMGLIKVDSGSIMWDGSNIVNQPSNLRVSAGIGYVPEEHGVFTSLTVEENLMIGFNKKALDESEIFDLFPILKERKRQLAGTLSGGEQRILSTARAILGSPRILLIDEFSHGLSPSVIKIIVQALYKINCTGVTIVLVEQNVRLSLQITERCYILEKGMIVLSDSSKNVENNEIILQKHLVI